MNQKQLETYVWGAANLLRGLIDAADFKQYIFPLLFFKRISDLWDEEYQQALAESGNDLDYAEFREIHRFEIPKLSFRLKIWTKTRLARKLGVCLNPKSLTNALMIFPCCCRYSASAYSWIRFSMSK